MTAIVTAAALVAAVLDGRDAVVLSNEWSASVPTVVTGGRAVNHQWSKSEEFEVAFADLCARTLGPLPVGVLVPAASHRALGGAAFRRSDGSTRPSAAATAPSTRTRAQRLDHWCGTCDKCCFIDLVLAPFMDAADLGAVFAGDEPLENPRTRSASPPSSTWATARSPSSASGDADECRAALVLAPSVRTAPAPILLSRCAPSWASDARAADAAPAPTAGDHHIPERYAPADLLVRAR